MPTLRVPTLRVSDDTAFLSSGEINELFLRLCREVQPSVICDIGTRDCLDSVAMKQASPTSQVIAFEANPENFFDFCLRDNVLREGVIPQLVALSDHPGLTQIKIPEYASRQCGGTTQQRGTSSLLPRAQTVRFVEYTVPQTTLDIFFEGRDGQQDSTYGIWMDVEGLASKVLTGMRRVLTRTVFLKVEVEDIAYYKGQDLSGDVIKVMHESGFEAVAQTDPAPGQFDLLFLNQVLAPR
jgi:FkbM family methyltransferase